VTSILPGTLVRSLVTAVHRTGVNLQILGYFDGTVDEFHLPPNTSYTIGKKLKARVLYHFSSSPPRFALSLAEHVLGLRLRRVGDETSFNIQEAYPIGTSLECAKVLKTEQERGLVVEVLPGLEGFVHVCSQTVCCVYLLMGSRLDFSNIRRPCAIPLVIFWSLEDWYHPSSSSYRLFSS
jgi:rRNA biogenesis protein RRP5